MSENNSQLSQIPPEKNSTLKKALLFAIILIVVAVAGFYLAFPFLGIVIAMSATAWAVVVSTIVFFSVAVLLFFIIPGVLVFLLSVLALIWTGMAVVLFPVLFPIIVPVLIILLVIGFIRKRKK